jgi:transcriptional regulator with XRE-family HTH domain
MVIADILKKHRRDKRLQQKEISDKLGYASAQFVSNWERGISEPPLKDAAQVCEMLDISKAKYKQILINRYKDQIEEAFR